MPKVYDIGLQDQGFRTLECVSKAFYFDNMSSTSLYSLLSLDITLFLTSSVAHQPGNFESGPGFSARYLFETIFTDLKFKFKNKDDLNIFL